MSQTATKSSVPQLNRWRYLFWGGLLILLAACSSLSSSGTPESGLAEDNTAVFQSPAAETAVATAVTKASQPWKIAYVVKSVDPDNDYWARTTNAAVTAAAEIGIDLEVLGPLEESDVATQISIMQTLITQQIDGIILAPTDTNRLAPIVETAYEADIPVIIHDTPINSSKILTFIVFDNRAAGQAMGEWVAQTVDSGNALLLEGIANQQNALDRRTGFLIGLRSGDINVLDLETANWDRETAYNITQGWLDEFSDIDVIIAANDRMALGAAQAVQDANREEIIITGFDANAAALAAIEAAQLNATIDQVPDLQAQQALEVMVGYLETGESVPPLLLWQDIAIITENNINQFMQN